MKFQLEHNANRRGRKWRVVEYRGTEIHTYFFWRQKNARRFIREQRGEDRWELVI